MPMRCASLVSARLLPGLLAALSCSVNADAPVALPSGEYELTSETVLPHLAEALRYTTIRTRRCLCPPDATSMFALLQHQAFTGCALVPDGKTRDSLRYTLSCLNPEAATGIAVFDFEGDSISAVLQLKMGGKNMTLSQRVYGQRIGPCPQSSVP